MSDAANDLRAVTASRLRELASRLTRGERIPLIVIEPGVQETCFIEYGISADMAVNAAHGLCKRAADAIEPRLGTFSGDTKAYALKLLDAARTAQIAMEAASGIEMQCGKPS